MMNPLQPKIYIACLAAYNNGTLQGAWIEAHQDYDALCAAVATVLKSSPIANADEWAIHAYDDFGSIELSESTDLKTVSEIAEFLVNHGELGAAILDHTNPYDIEAATRILDEHYHGEYERIVDFVIEMASETMEIPEHLEHYINYEDMAWDWFINDYFSIEIGHKVHVFSTY